MPLSPSADAAECVSASTSALHVCVSLSDPYVSVVDDSYRLVNAPTVIDLPGV